MIADARAFSIDGRTFEFDAPIADVLPLGGFVDIDTGDARHLGQIVDERAGRLDTGEPYVVGSGIVVGTIGPAGELAPPAAAPFGGASVASADAETIRAHLAQGKPDRATLDVGRALIADDVPATLHATGFTRHTFMCGQSGSGKTYATGVVLERLLTATDLPIFVLDPNSDYVHLGRARAVDEVGIREEAQRHTRDRLGEVSPRVQVFGGDRLPLRVWFGHLTGQQQVMVLGLDPLADAEEYDAARRIIEGIGSRDYTLRDLRDRAAESDEPAARKLRLRIENLGLLDLSVWASAGEAAVMDHLDRDARAVVFDLGSLATTRERSIISAAVLTWLWEQRRTRRPVLLVVDEAHNVCPQVPIDPSQALGLDQMIAIAGEGRKFGLHLMLATQQPQKVHESVLTQCGNLILMKMNAVTDIRTLVATFSFVPPALIEMSSGFGLGQALAAGPIATSPLLFKTGERYTPEGGADIPTTWARSRH